MKIKTTLLFLLSSLIGCTTASQPYDKSFSTLSNNSDLKTSVRPSPFDFSKIPDKIGSPSIVFTNDKNRLEEIENEKNKFDFLPPDDNISYDGCITVIFKNSYKVRVDKSNKKIYSIEKADLSNLNFILERASITNAYDVGNYIPNTDNELDKMQSNYVKNHNIDIPHLRSIHYYKVAKETDTKSLSKELMKLPYVRLAYPTSKLKTNHEYLLSTVGYGELAVNPTPDFYTNSTDPQNSNNDFINYYWFNQHNIFKAKTYYKNNTNQKPKIAIIDEDFDPNSPELNLLPGYKIEDPWWPWSPVTIKSGSIDCPNNNCIKSNDTISHGHSVSYVAAAINNNDDSVEATHGEGVAEGAYILPINTDKKDDSIIGAIVTARNQLVDTINISLGKENGDPITFSPEVNAAISYAVDDGIPVIVSAGNVNKSLNPPSGYSSDAIVVGGSMPSNLSSSFQHYIRWQDPLISSKATNYFDRTLNKPNPIDVAAAAYEILFQGYNPTNDARLATRDSGTSLAAPMVAATAAMMKKIQ